MGINRNIEVSSSWLLAVFGAISSIGSAKKTPTVKPGSDKYNPLCEYILKTDDREKAYIASLNTRQAARMIKRELQRDKGIKITITQITYASDRFKGGMILDTKVVR